MKIKNIGSETILLSYGSKMKKLLSNEEFEFEEKKFKIIKKQIMKSELSIFLFVLGMIVGLLILFVYFLLEMLAFNEPSKWYEQVDFMDIELEFQSDEEYIEIEYIKGVNSPRFIEEKQDPYFKINGQVYYGECLFKQENVLESFKAYCFEIGFKTFILCAPWIVCIILMGNLNEAGFFVLMIMFSLLFFLALVIPAYFDYKNCVNQYKNEELRRKMEK